MKDLKKRRSLSDDVCYCIIYKTCSILLIKSSMSLPMELFSLLPLRKLLSIVIYLISVTIETLHVSIADICTFHLNFTCRNAADC